MALKDKKIVILLEDNYQELEFWYPFYRLQEAGATPIVVGPKAKRTYKSKLGYPAESEVTADEIEVKEINGLIIPGGYAPDKMRINKPMLELVRNAFNQDKVVAAICHAAWVLVSADILKGKRVTCYHTIKDDVINAGGNYVDEAVVSDNNLITSRIPDDLPQFCKAIINLLASK